METLSSTLPGIGNMWGFSSEVPQWLDGHGKRNKLNGKGRRKSRCKRDLGGCTLSQGEFFQTLIGKGKRHLFWIPCSVLR